MMHIYCDCDGCLTPTKKSYYFADNRLQKIKSFNDKDLYIFGLLKDNITIISKDHIINEQWAHSHNIDFIYVPSDSKKELHIRHKEYIYIGDTMHDFECMKNATRAFMPLDGSRILYDKLLQSKSNIEIININGGDGILEYVYWTLYGIDQIK